MDDHALVTLATVYEIILTWTPPCEFENTTAIPPSESVEETADQAGE